MSEVVKAVFINYIICALVGGFLEFFAPSKSRKTLRIIVMAVVLISSFAPVLKMEINFPELEGYDEVYEKNNYDTLMHTASLTEKKVYNEVRDVLINSGVSEYEIYVTTSVEEETNTVWLEKVTIEIPVEFKEKQDEIKRTISEEYRGVTEVGEK